MVSAARIGKTSMITSLNIENFKVFRKFEQQEFLPLTLIAGRNNSGKSCLLEAIFLLLASHGADVFGKINNLRGFGGAVTPELLWRYVFNLHEHADKLSISLTTDDGITHSLSLIKNTDSLSYKDVPLSKSLTPSDSMLSLPDEEGLGLSFEFCQCSQDKQVFKEQGVFAVFPDRVIRQTSLSEGKTVPLPKAQFINSRMAFGEPFDWFYNLELSGNKSRIIEVLNLMDKEVADILILTRLGVNRLYVKYRNGELIPLRMVGDGLIRLFYMIAALLEEKHKILLIDEIENGFHYSVFPTLWKTLLDLAIENHAQIISTTHSFDCIHGSLDGISGKELEKYFSFIRLDSNHEPKYFKGDLYEYAVNNKFEVR